MPKYHGSSMVYVGVTLWDNLILLFVLLSVVTTCQAQKLPSVELVQTKFETTQVIPRGIIFKGNSIAFNYKRCLVYYDLNKKELRDSTLIPIDKYQEVMGLASNQNTVFVFKNAAYRFDYSHDSSIVLIANKKINYLDLSGTKLTQNQAIKNPYISVFGVVQPVLQNEHLYLPVYFFSPKNELNMDSIDVFYKINWKTNQTQPYRLKLSDFKFLKDEFTWDMYSDLAILASKDSSKILIFKIQKESMKLVDSVEVATKSQTFFGYRNIGFLNNKTIFRIVALNPNKRLYSIIFYHLQTKQKLEYNLPEGCFPFYSTWNGNIGWFYDEKKSLESGKITFQKITFPL